MSIVDLKDNINSAFTEAQSLVEINVAYLRLKIFKSSMQLVTSVAKSLWVGAFAVMALFFVSFSGALALGEILGSWVYGFLVVGVLYILIAIIAYRFRDKLDKPILEKFSDQTFDES